MMTESEVRDICRRAIALSGAPATEVRFAAERSGLTRLANNEVSQSIEQDRAVVSIRVLLGPPGAPTQAGVASTNRLDEQGLAAAVRRATEVAGLQHDDPTLLPPLGPMSYRPAGQFDPATADCSPGQRVEALRGVLKRCRQEGLVCAGMFSTATSCQAVATSAGLFAFDHHTEADLSLTVSQGDASGWDQRVSPGLAEMDAQAVAERAIDIAARSQGARPVEPGPYTVVLPPAAVADLLLFLAMGGLTTKAILEGRSFLSGKLGQKVFGENVTIRDDAYLPLTAGLPFDGEGWPKQAVTIIDGGVFARMVHGRETARLASAEPTGHGRVPPSSEGAMPFNLVVEPGQATIEEMIGSVDRGLLVTHFHYTNMLRPVDLTITGMTRDGLFLIERGKVGRAVNNMRFTDSLVRAFSNVAMLGRQLSRVEGFGAGYFAAPAMKIEGFNFSSATEF